MMDHIPVNFEFNGKEYSGHLSAVMRTGASSMFHLNVDGFHWGQLSHIEGHPGFNGLHAVPKGWRLNSNSQPELSELADYLGNIVNCGMSRQ